MPMHLRSIISGRARIAVSALAVTLAKDPIDASTACIVELLLSTIMSSAATVKYTIPAASRHTATVILIHVRTRQSRQTFADPTIAVCAQSLSGIRR